MEEAAVDVVAPAQHEVHQEGDERHHQQNLVNRGQPRGNESSHRLRFGVNAHLENAVGAECQALRLRGAGGLLRLGCGLLLRPLAGLFFANAAGGENLQGAVFGPRDPLRDAVHDVADPLPVLGQIPVDHGKLRIRSQADHPKKQQRHRAHHEAGQAARQAEAHQQRHQRLQNEGDGHRHQDGDEQRAAEIQQGDGHSQGHHGEGQVARLRHGGSGAGRMPSREGHCG